MVKGTLPFLPKYALCQNHISWSMNNILCSKSYPPTWGAKITRGGLMDSLYMLVLHHCSFFASYTRKIPNTWELEHLWKPTCANIWNNFLTSLWARNTTLWAFKPPIAQNHLHLAKQGTPCSLISTTQIPRAFCLKLVQTPSIQHIQAIPTLKH